MFKVLISESVLIKEIRIMFMHALITDTMGKVNIRMICNVLFYFFPKTIFITYIFTMHTDRDKSPQLLYISQLMRQLSVIFP